MAGLPNLRIFGALMRSQHAMLIAAAALFMGPRGLLLGLLVWCVAGQPPCLLGIAQGRSSGGARAGACAVRCCGLMSTAWIPRCPLRSCDVDINTLRPPALPRRWIYSGSAAGQAAQQPGQAQRAAAAQDRLSRLLGQAPLGRAGDAPHGGHGGGGGPGPAAAAAAQPQDPWAARGRARKLNES